MKIIKNHWVKILSILFFILLFGSYAQIFAVFSPGQTLNPNCAPGSTGCIVESVPSQLGNANKYLTTDGTNMSWVSTPVGVTASSTEVFTNKDLTSSTNTFPIFNQNTTGTSAGLSSAYIDWNALSGGSSILNKPSIPSTLASLADDVTHRLVTDTEKSTWNNKQSALVSGTNIKTINSTSLLGIGDISIASMTWPTGGAGIPNYSGSSSWGTSYTTNGSGTVLALATTPTFTTNITTPLVLGGSSTTSPLTFQTTSGAGTTGADMHFKVGNAGGTEALTILNNGNVGIGTTTPGRNLEILSDGSSTTRGVLINTVGGGSNAGALVFQKSEGSVGSLSSVVNGDYTMSIGARNYDGTSYVAGGSFGYKVIGTVGTNNVPGQWYWAASNTHDSDPYTNGNVRMVINSTGNVGIGTTDPTCKLDVLDNIAAGSLSLRILNTNASGYSIFRAGASGVELKFGSYGSTYATTPYRLNSLLATNGTKLRIAATDAAGVITFHTAGQDDTTERMIINSSGNVGIGTTGPGYLLHVGNNTVSGIIARFQNSTGTCDINPTTSSLACSSDINLKKNIKTLDGVEFNLQTIPDLTNKTTLEKINYLIPVNYNWKSESDTNAKHIGFIAQEMEQIFPNLVSTDSETGLKSISYSSVTPYLVKAIQEMDLNIKDLSSLDTSSAASLGSLVKNFLGNIGNSIDIVFFGEVHTKKLCLDDLCITKDELKQILDHTNVSNLPPSAPSASTTTSSADSAPTTTQSSPTPDSSATPPSTPGATTTPSAPSSPITASSTDSASATSQSSSTSDASANPAATPSAPAVNSSTDSASATSQSSATPDTNA